MYFPIWTVAERPVFIWVVVVGWSGDVVWSVLDVEVDIVVCLARLRGGGREVVLEVCGRLRGGGSVVLDESGLLRFSAWLLRECAVGSLRKRTLVVAGEDLISEDAIRDCSRFQFEERVVRSILMARNMYSDSCNRRCHCWLL